MSAQPHLTPDAPAPRLTEAELDAAIHANRAAWDDADWAQVTARHGDGLPRPLPPTDMDGEPHPAPLLWLTVAVMAVAIVFMLWLALDALWAHAAAGALYTAHAVPVATGARRSMLRYTGPLLRPAWTRMSPEGTAWLCVQVAQDTAGGVPVHAEHRLGQGPAAQQVATLSAAHLRTGTVVTVRARHFRLQRNPDCLLLVDVQGIEYPAPKARQEVDA